MKRPAYAGLFYFSALDATQEIAYYVAPHQQTTPLSHLALLIWIINVTLDTTGHIALKHAAIIDGKTELERWKAMLSSIPLWLGVVCFCLEFIVWLAFLSVLTLSQGVLLGAISTVSIVVAGRLIFKEHLDRNRVIGILLITFGVALVGIFA